MMVASGLRHQGGGSVLGSDGRLSGLKVTVIGAGIAGLALARGLCLRGADVQVFEQADAIREVGAGLQIAPNGAAVLWGLGLGDDLARIGVPGGTLELLNGQTGARLIRMDLRRGAVSSNYHFVHRADLIEVLRKAAVAAGAVITLGAKVQAVDLNGDAPVLHISGGQTRTAPLVIGADGLHSALRSAICGPRAPFFTGQVAWRATIVGDDLTAGAGLNTVQVHMGAGRHLVSYPLRGGAMRNIVAVQQRSAPARESWSVQPDPKGLTAAFASFSPQVRAWIGQAHDAGLWGLYRHEIAPHWSSILPKGAAVLLGDAAHPTLPFLAQGANMALEDGAILTALLDRLAPAEALARYQTLRAPRVARIVAAANKNASNYHLSGPARVLAHAALRSIGAVAPQIMLRRFDWLYGYDATKVS